LKEGRTELPLEVNFVVPEIILLCFEVLRVEVFMKTILVSE
jgi:hypothetical protein